MTDQLEGRRAGAAAQPQSTIRLHERVALITIQTARYAARQRPGPDRFMFHRMGKGFMRIIARFGFMESPDIQAVWMCKHHGERRLMETFYLSRETIVPSMTKRMTIPARGFAGDVEERHQRQRFFPNPDQSGGRTGDAAGDLTGTRRLRWTRKMA